MVELLPDKFIEPLLRYRSAVEFITEAVKTPVPVILISFVQTRPFEIIDPVVFVVIFQNPVHPVKVGFTDPLKILDTVMEGKVH